VIAVLAILLLFGLIERRAYCNGAVSFSKQESDGLINERQGFLCGWFSLE
jgi:hypothetical protein